MTRVRISAIAHGDRPFHNPFEARRVDEVLDVLAPRPGARVLDVGCGPGELLIRAAERHACAGLGVDAEELQIDEARRRAAARAPNADVRFEVDDGRSGAPPGAPFDLVACIGSMHAAGEGLAGAVERLASLVRPGGHVLVGDGFWRRAPEPAYLNALGASAEELPDLPGLLGAGAPAGLEPVHASLASDEEWDRYEWTLIFNALRFAAEHPDDPDAAAAADRARAARARYTGPGGRDTLGFALVLFARDGAA